MNYSSFYYRVTELTGFNILVTRKALFRLVAACSAFSSKLTISSLSFSLAKYKGVSQLLVSMLTSAPFSKRSFTISKLSFMTATRSGVQPPSPTALTFITSKLHMSIIASAYLVFTLFRIPILLKYFQSFVS